MPAIPKRKRKVKRVMHEFKEGDLRSSSGSKVKKREQAAAIAISESGLSRKAPRKKATAKR